MSEIAGYRHPFLPSPRAVAKMRASTPRRMTANDGHAAAAFLLRHAPLSPSPRSPLLLLLLHLRRPRASSHPASDDVVGRHRPGRRPERRRRHPSGRRRRRARERRGAQQERECDECRASRRGGNDDDDDDDDAAGREEERRRTRSRRMRRRLPSSRRVAITPLGVIVVALFREGTMLLPTSWRCDFCDGARAPTVCCVRGITGRRSKAGQRLVTNEEE